jgi:hypothetical protein
MLLGVLASKKAEADDLVEFLSNTVYSEISAVRNRLVNGCFLALVPVCLCPASLKEHT